MADKKVKKYVKRWRRNRRARRLEKCFAVVIDVLKEKNTREKITLFTDDEKKRYFSKKDAFGTITCPVCNKKLIFVANKNGSEGDPLDDYIMRHNAKTFLCDASLAFVKNLFT